VEIHRGGSGYCQSRASAAGDQPLSEILWADHKNIRVAHVHVSPVIDIDSTIQKPSLRVPFCKLQYLGVLILDSSPAEQPSAESNQSHHLFYPKPSSCGPNCSCWSACLDVPARAPFFSSPSLNASAVRLYLAFLACCTSTLGCSCWQVWKDDV